MYPGDQVGLPGLVIASMRLKYLRDGVDDYDYLELQSRPVMATGRSPWRAAWVRTGAIGPATRTPWRAVRLRLGNKLDSLAPLSDRVDVSVSANPSTVTVGATTKLAPRRPPTRSGMPLLSWSWSDGGREAGSPPPPRRTRPTRFPPCSRAADDHPHGDGDGRGGAARLRARRLGDLGRADEFATRSP